jgi:hypothetical protein
MIFYCDNFNLNYQLKSNYFTCFHSLGYCKSYVVTSLCKEDKKSQLLFCFVIAQPCLDSGRFKLFYFLVLFTYTAPKLKHMDLYL